jgi:hypothetical protein
MKSCVVTFVFMLLFFLFSFQFVSAQINSERVSTTSVNNTNYALQFDGNNDIVDINASPSLDMSDAVTMEAWVFHSGSGSGSDYDVIMARGGEYEVAVHKNREVNFAINASSIGWVWINSGYFLSDNIWTHIAVTYSATSQHMIFYVNGTQKFLRSANGNINKLHQTEHMVIGNWNVLTSGFKGIIDEVRLWNSALSSSTIQKWMNKIVTSSHPNFSNLKGYWKFNEGTGLTTADASENGNTGSLVNGPIWIPSTYPMVGTGRIRGNKFFDKNINGQKDIDELGIDNWKIILSGSWLESTYMDSTYTDSTGNYTFNNLATGNYTVSEEQKAGWIQTLPVLPGTYNLDLVSGDDIRSIDFGNYYSESGTYNKGWNIVSLPNKVTNNTIITLFPSAISYGFMYINGTGYVQSDSVINRYGYWIKFSSDQDVHFEGIPLPLDTIDVVTGWNLIGSISDRISTTNIQRIPTDMVISDLFGYSNGYFVSNIIEPGKGYWIKVNKIGKLILKSSTNRN